MEPGEPSKWPSFAVFIMELPTWDPITRYNRTPSNIIPHLPLMIMSHNSLCNSNYSVFDRFSTRSSSLFSLSRSCYLVPLSKSLIAHLGVHHHIFGINFVIYFVSFILTNQPLSHFTFTSFPRTISTFFKYFFIILTTRHWWIPGLKLTWVTWFKIYLSCKSFPSRTLDTMQPDYLRGLWHSCWIFALSFYLCFFFGSFCCG